MIEKLDILTLDDNKKYTVIEILKYNNNDYLLLNEVDDNEELLEHRKIVKEIKNDDGIEVIEIEGNELKIIADAINKLFERDYV
jgi:hypothetical protein